MVLNEFESKYRNKLFHGVNSYCTIEFHTNPSSAELDFGFVEKVELNRSINTITETYIGLYGEPSFNAPTSVEYHGTVKKKLSDDTKFRGGRESADGDTTGEEAGYLTNSILKFKDGDQKAFGTNLLWDLKIYTINDHERLITIARNCTVTNHKRVIDRAGFIIDEYAFKFTRFEQRIVPVN